MFEHLSLYIEILASMLFRGNLYSEQVRRLVLFAIYRVVNCAAYNEGAKEKPNHSDGIGILVSPSKFKNFEP